VNAALVEPFPQVGVLMMRAYADLARVEQAKNLDEVRDLGPLELLPRPWDVTSCRDAGLRREVWDWLDAVVGWINTQHVWLADSLVPGCWPRHPHLVHEIGCLADQRRRAEELERIDATRTSLLAAVVHDLRTPLATISSSAELLVADLDLPDYQRRELVDHVARAARSLSSLLDNLLDVTRLQAGVLIAHLAPTDVADALDCGPDFDWSAVTVDLPDDLPMVRGDAGLLERVLCNLLENAARHSPPGTPVTLTARREGEGVTIRVADHGPGVDPGRFADLFTPFERLGRGGSGLGLGLAIARGFTEAMGGRLVPSTTPGGGLTMTVELEVADDPPADR